MNKIFLFAFVLLISFRASAQMVTDSVSKNVYVVRDSRYDALIKKKAEINKKASDSKKPSKGYRIQVLNTTDRTQAFSAKSKLLSQFPEHKTYVMYQTPYFKLRIGNFVERKEADNLKKQLARIFPTGVFVIPSEIEVKPEKDKEEDR